MIQDYATGLPGALGLGSPASGAPAYAGARSAPAIPPSWVKPRDIMRRFQRCQPADLPVDGCIELAGRRVPYFIARTSDQVIQAAQWVVRQPALSLDTETSDKRGIYTPGFRLRTVQLATPHQIVYIPYNEMSHPYLVGMLEVVPAFLIHNASFDLAVLDRFNVVDLDAVWPKTVDSMLYAQLVQHPKTRNGDGSWPAGLKDLVRKLVDPGYGDDRDLRLRMAQGDREWVAQKRDPTKGRWRRGPEPWTWATVPLDLPEFVHYAVSDPWITLSMFRELLTAGRAADEGLYEYEARNAWLMCRLVRRGLAVDTANAKRLVEQFHRRQFEIERLFVAFDLDVEAPDTHENKQRFVEAMQWYGIELTKRTKEGLPALDHETLTAACLAAGKPDNEMYLAWTDLHQTAKYESAYVNPFLEAAAGDGRVHPSIRTLGARTGRMSISDPALQQLPRLGDVRSCLMADPGWWLVGADYSAIEMCVAAALSGDAHMMDLVRRGVDIHGVVAEAVFGKGFTKEQRTVAKRAGFGRLYGAGATTVARQCGVPIEVARRALAMFDRQFPGVKDYAHWVADEGELITFTGRRIRADLSRPYANINYMVQSSARDVFMLGGLRAAGAGLEPYMWLPIHDEWIVQGPQEDAEEMGRVLESALASSMRGVPFRAEAQLVGANWVKK